MHEAKTRLSQLVAAALDGEEVIVCSDGKPRVRLAPVTEDRPIRRDLIPPDPALKVVFAPGYNPTEPLSDDEWPEDCR
jgi:prevent-host-death family protein